MKHVKRRSELSNMLIYMLAAIVFIIVLFPFYWILVTSFKETLAIYELPPRLFPKYFDFDNYIRSFTQYNVNSYFLNSLRVTLATVVFTTLFASSAAFALTRLEFKGNALIRRFLGTTQMFPVVVLLVPLFMLCNKFHLYNTLPSLVIPYVALQLPVSIILQSSYYRDVPKALEDAATLDGCNTFQVLWHVFFPLVTPGVVATSVYTFIQVWQEFLIASSFITSRSRFTLTVGLTTFRGDEMTDWGALMATSVIIAVPALILFNLAQDFFINKIAGSVKE
ncbi:carbohydrate ABC transporter permease [Treponema sp. OMZ 840]|uniref:carbohydrate ABC transporter permease n=1 Tax=Treponema sp. OMZ 840 TaxID=244313 RepID=UPI003D94C91A